MPLKTPNPPHIATDPSFTNFLPAEFIADPLSYFQSKGINIKSGEPTYNEHGVIDEDPTAVKDLPLWTNPEGQALATVAKRVNTEKAQIKKTADPFYEYKVMEIIQKLGLPVSKPIVKVEQSGIHMIVMERVKGLRWVNNDIKLLKAKGYR